MTRPNNFNRLQHYLPVGYLKHFSNDTHTRPARNRKTWAYSKNSQSLKYLKLKYLCSEIDFYTSDGDKEFRAHDSIDQRLSLSIDQFIKLNIPNVSNKDPLGYELLVQGCYLRVRGNSLEKRTAAERLKVADISVRTFVNTHLLDAPNANPIERAQLLREKWSTVKILGPKDWLLFTSDNPVMFFNYNKVEICLIIFPLDQNTYFVAYKDSRIKVVCTKATPNDATTLIGYTIANAYDLVISSTLDQYTPTGLATFLIPPYAKNYVDDKYLQLTAFDFEGILEKLSFLRLKKKPSRRGLFYIEVKNWIVQSTSD